MTYRTPAQLLAEPTLAAVHRILHRAVRDAVRRRIIRSNPAADATVPRSTAPREMKVWTSQEVREFLDSVGSDRLRALWLLAVTTGMRRGELCGLMWKDVNFEASNVAVRRARVPIAGKVAGGTPKSDPLASSLSRPQRSRPCARTARANSKSGSRGARRGRTAATCSPRPTGRPHGPTP